MTSPHQGAFLEGAARIGARLVADARWDGDACTWQIMALDRMNRRVKTAVPEIAGGGLYQGSAGIALFLAELYRLAGDADIGRTAVGGARHALRFASSPSFAPMSFHSGSVGVAYAVARTGAVVGHPDLMAAAADVISKLRGRESEDRAYDVISGGAGAIPALLQLSRWLADDIPREIALTLGAHLIRQARLEPVGWSWTTSKNAVVRNLTGYAHGAAGIGHAFTELYQSTGSAEFRYAAEQAFTYERQFFDAATDNWPDFRHQALGMYEYEGRLGELAEEMRNGSPPPAHRPSSMHAWCHGAPGIGLSRLRALQVFRLPIYETEARAAIRATLATLIGPGSNFSACHGVMGNCETLVLAAEVLGQPALRARAEQAALFGLERFGTEGHRWPCGTANAVPDSSLMLGEAGIGHCLLRLHDSTTPSVLLLAGSTERPPTEVGHEKAEHQRQRYVSAYFTNTLVALSRLGHGTVWSRCVPDAGCDGESDVAQAFRVIEEIIEGDLDVERRTALRDILKLDRARYELTLAITDFSEPQLRELAPPTAHVRAVSHTPHRLSATSRLVTLEYDWPAWLPGTAETHPGMPAARRGTFLAHRSQNRIVVRQLEAFTEAVLRCFEQPSTPADAVQGLRPGDAGDQSASWEQFIYDQVGEARRAGILVEVATAQVSEPAPRALAIETAAAL